MTASPVPANSASSAAAGKGLWWALTVSCPLALEETVYWALDELGAQGTASQTQDNRRLVTAYFPQGQIQPEAFEALRQQLMEMAQAMAEPLGNRQSLAVSVSWQTIAEEDWSQSWKRHWQPQTIGDHLVINPAWLPAPAFDGRDGKAFQGNRTILTLDPGSAFGTGAHATTQLCLEALEKQDLAGATLADIGCGSGILSIAALLYGARRVFAADVDPLAVSATHANASLNGLSEQQLSAQLGSVAEILTTARSAEDLPLTGIVCNILAEIIVGLIIPYMGELAGPQTWAILSGILTRKAPWVEEHLTAYGWQVSAMAYQGEWCAMTLCRQA